MTRCCMDCGNRLKELNFNESCTKYECLECGVYWFNTRKVVVEWVRQDKPLESDNGGVNAQTAGTDKSWYDQAQELHQSLLKQDKVIDGLRKQLKEAKKEKTRIITLDNKLLKNRKDEISHYESTLSEILTTIDHYEGDVLSKVYEIAINNLKNQD